MYSTCYDSVSFCLCFILNPCPFCVSSGFHCLLCVCPSVSLHYLTCPFPSSLTSPVPDPLVSVSVYLVFVLPGLLICSFCHPSTFVRLLVMFCSVSSCVSLIGMFLILILLVSLVCLFFKLYLFLCIVFSF